MKYLKYLILLILLVPVKVGAAITLNCNEPLMSNKVVTCNINSTEDIVSFETKVYVSTNVQYYGDIAGSNFISKSINKELSYTSNSGGKEIASIDINVPSSVKNGDVVAINLLNIKYKLSNNNEVNEPPIYKEYKVGGNTTTTTTKPTNTTTTTTKKTDTNKTFTVTLDSNNSTGKKELLTCSGVSSCDIDLTKALSPAKSGSKFTGWGDSASCTTGITSSFKLEADLTLYACYEDVTEVADLFLKSLSIEGQIIEFSKFKQEYDLTVLYEVEELVIKAEATEDITVSIGESTLEVGDNIITITLTDKYNGTKTYTINVKRLKEGEIIKELSSDATLKSVSLGKYSVEFSPLVDNYTIFVDPKTTSIPVTAETSDENATYEVVGNTDLSDGVIKITVTAEDGTKNIYNFHISKKASFFEQYLLYIIVVGALLIILIILLVISNKKKKKPVKKNKAPTKAPIKKSVSSVPPKNDIEVLDI